MPYLRFSRDKRGYENTYVLHTYRRGGRSQPTLLYWFRTPPGVKVGRLPLDEEAIRAIEENNPDLSFDWTKMLKVRPASKPEPTRGPSSQVSSDRKRTRRGGGRGKGNGGTARATEGQARATEAEPPAGELAAAEASAQMTPDVLREVHDVHQVTKDEGEGRDAEWQHPVVALMGDETLARLRARYAEIQVRINEKLEDAVASDAMRSRAEALNPDRWKTVEEAVRGIETFESEAEAIKAVLGRRRPRTRKGTRGSESTGAGAAGVSSQLTSAGVKEMPSPEMKEDPGGEPLTDEPVREITSDQADSADVEKA